MSWRGLKIRSVWKGYFINIEPVPQATLCIGQGILRYMRLGECQLVHAPASQIREFQLQFNSTEMRAAAIKVLGSVIYPRNMW